MITNNKRAGAEARALELALLVAVRAGWTFGRGPMPHNAFAHYLYIEAAQLLLAPTTAGLDFAIRQAEPVLREARADALIVSRPDRRLPSFAFATWAPLETAWTLPLEPWIDPSGELWLVPPVGSSNELGFRLANALHHASRVPWNSEVGRQAGLRRAVEWMGHR